MAKFWYVNRYSTVEKQPRSERQELLGSNISSSGLLTLRSSSYSSGLNVLESFQDFIIRHNKTEKLCSSNTYYNVSSGENKMLFTGVQENYCCCFKDPYEKVSFYDKQNHIILQLQKTDFSGYISTKLRFTVSSPPGHIIGEIIRITEFLDPPKYEVNDGHGQLIFSLSTPCQASTSRHGHVLDYYVTSKYGKVAHIQEEKGTFMMKIIQVCSTIDKALLISLGIFLDIVKRAGSG